MCVFLEHSLTLTLTLTLTLSHSHTLTLPHSHTHLLTHSKMNRLESLSYSYPDGEDLLVIHLQGFRFILFILVEIENQQETVFEVLEI